MPGLLNTFKKKKKGKKIYLHHRPAQHQPDQTEGSQVECCYTNKSPPWSDFPRFQVPTPLWPKERVGWLPAEENTSGGQGTARGNPQVSCWYHGWGTILHQASILRSTPSSVLLRGTKPCLIQPWSTLWFPTGHEAASVTVKCNSPRKPLLGWMELRWHLQ